MTIAALTAGRSEISEGLPCTAARWAGVGGLTFVALVVLQNVLMAAAAPANQATGQEILAFAHRDAWLVQLLFVTYVMGFPALLAFSGGLSALAAAREARAILPGLIGQYSVVLVAVLFGLINVLQVTLVVARADLAGDLVLVSTLWTLHNAIFTLNFVGVAGALFGLGRAAVVSSIVPAWMDRVSITGALALAVAALPIVAEVHGSMLLGLGLAGFLCWLFFLAVAAVSLVRMPAAFEPHALATQSSK